MTGFLIFFAVALLLVALLSRDVFKELLRTILGGVGRVVGIGIFALFFSALLAALLNGKLPPYAIIGLFGIYLLVKMLISSMNRVSERRAEQAQYEAGQGRP